MKKLMAMIVCAVTLAGSAPAVEFNVNLSDLNADIYDFNGFSEDASDIGFDLTMTVTQEGGKLTAFGDFNAYEDGVFLYGDYIIKGTLSTYQNSLRLKFVTTMKGSVQYEGQVGKFSASITDDVVLNPTLGIMVGKSSVRLNVVGYSESYTEVTVWDAPVGYGVGSTDLDVLLAGDKILAGTGIMNLPSGEQVHFVCSSSLDSKTMQYKTILSGVKDDPFSNGSKLSLIIVSNQLKSVSGTVLGQSVKYDAAVKNFDGIYSGRYSDNYEVGTWVISVNNGKISGSSTGSLMGYSEIEGHVESTGSFTFFTDFGNQGKGKINPTTGAVTGSYLNPLAGVKGKYIGTRSAL